MPIQKRVVWIVIYTLKIYYSSKRARVSPTVGRLLDVQGLAVGLRYIHTETHSLR